MPKGFLSKRSIQIELKKSNLFDFLRLKPNSKNNLIPQPDISRESASSTQSTAGSMTDLPYHLKEMEPVDLADLTSLSSFDTDSIRASGSPSTTASYSVSSSSSIQQESPRTESVTSFEAKRDLSQLRDSFSQKDHVSILPSSRASAIEIDPERESLKNREATERINAIKGDTIREIDNYLELMGRGFDSREDSSAVSLISNGEKSVDLPPSESSFSQKDRASVIPSSRISALEMDKEGDEFIHTVLSEQTTEDIDNLLGDIDSLVKDYERDRELNYEQEKKFNYERKVKAGKFAPPPTPVEGEIKNKFVDLMEKIIQEGGPPFAKLIQAAMRPDPDEESLDSRSISSSFFDDEFDDESLKRGRLARPNTPQSERQPTAQELRTLHEMAEKLAELKELNSSINHAKQKSKETGFSAKLEQNDSSAEGNFNGVRNFDEFEKKRQKQILDSQLESLEFEQTLKKDKEDFEKKRQENLERKRQDIDKEKSGRESQYTDDSQSTYSSQRDLEGDDLRPIDSLLLKGGPTREEQELTPEETDLINKSSMQLLMMSTHPDIDISINALREGAKDGLQKPSSRNADFKRKDLLATTRDNSTPSKHGYEHIKEEDIGPLWKANRANAVNAGLISGDVFDSSMSQGDEDSIDLTLEDDAGLGTELDGIKHGVERTNFYRTSTASYYGSEAEMQPEVEVATNPQINSTPKNKAGIQYERLVGIAEEIRFAKEFLKYQMKEQRESFHSTRKELNEKLSSLTPKQKRKSKKSELELESEIVDLKGQFLNQNNGLNHLLLHEKDLEFCEKQIHDECVLLVRTNPNLSEYSLSPDLAPSIKAEELILSPASKYLLEHDSYIDFIETEKDRSRYDDALGKVEKELQDKLKLAEARLREMRNKYGSDFLDLPHARMVQNFNSHVEGLRAQSEKVAFTKQKMGGQQPESESSLTTPSSKKKIIPKLRKGIRLFDKSKKEQQKELKEMLDNFSKMAPIIREAKQSVNTVLDISGPIPHKDGISDYNSMLIDQSLRKHFNDENGKQPYLFKLITPPGENNRYTSFSGPCLHQIKDEETGKIKEAFYLIEGQRKGPLLVAHLNKDQLKHMPPIEIGDKCTIKVSSLTEPAVIINNANKPAKAKGLGSFKF